MGKAWSGASPQGAPESGAGWAGRGSRSSRVPASRRAARDGHPEHTRHRPCLPLCRPGARGRRNGKRVARDIPENIAMIRTIAPQEQLSATCLERSAQAERVVPKMQATIEFVSGYVRQQVRQLALAQPASYARHAPLIPSYDLERVAATRTVTQGEPLRALAE